MIVTVTGIVGTIVLIWAVVTITYPDLKMLLEGEEK